jgi:hypothetical protein
MATITMTAHIKIATAILFKFVSSFEPPPENTKGPVKDNLSPTQPPPSLFSFVFSTANAQLHLKMLVSVELENRVVNRRDVL